MKDSKFSFTIIVMYASVVIVSDGLISGYWFSNSHSWRGKKQKAVIFELLHLQALQILLTHKHALSSFSGYSSHFGICELKKKNI